MFARALARCQAEVGLLQAGERLHVWGGKEGEGEGEGEGERERERERERMDHATMGRDRWTGCSLKHSLARLPGNTTSASACVIASGLKRDMHV